MEGVSVSVYGANRTTGVYCIVIVTSIGAESTFPVTRVGKMEIASCLPPYIFTPAMWGPFILPQGSAYVFGQLRLGWRRHHFHGPSHSLRFHHLGHQHSWRHLPHHWPPLTRDPCPPPRIRVCLCFLLPISFSFTKNYLTNGMQDRQIFWLWRHHRHRLYPPPRLRRQRALFTMSFTSVARIRARSPRLSILIISILIGACDVALCPGVCSRVVLRHIYYRIDCLSHRHGQAQEAWHPPWYVWSPSAVASKQNAALILGPPVE
jgi:hypothetical protein